MKEENPAIARQRQADLSIFFPKEILSRDFLHNMTT